MKKLFLTLAILCFYSLSYAIDNYSKDFVAIDTDTAKPALLGTHTDTDFNTTFTRITDAQTQTGSWLASPFYSRFSPLNSDGTKLLIARNHNWNQLMLYNASTYAFEKLLDPATSGETIMVDGQYRSFAMMEAQEPRWSKTDPNIIYVVGNQNSGYGRMRLFEYDVANSAATTIHDFASAFPYANIILNGAEGDWSDDGRYYAMMLKYDAGDGSSYKCTYIICYDKQTDSIVGTFDYDDYVAAGGQYGNATYHSFPSPNMVDMSPSGNKVVCLWGRCYTGYEPYGRANDIGTIFDGPHAFDKDMSAASAIKVAIDQTHTGWGYDANLNELFVSQNNRTDWIDATNVLTGESFRTLYHGDLGWSNGMHFARMPLLSNCTGWILMSTYRGNGENNTSWGDDQLLMLELVDKDIQTPRVYRLGHTWNKYNDYRSEGFAAMSQFGDKFWVAAKWWDGEDIECYEMNMPADFGGEAVTPPPPVVPESTNYTQDSDILFALLMDSDSNPLPDSSHNNLTGTKKAATEPAYASGNIPMSYSSGYMDFDGTDDYVYVSSAIALGKQDFSAVFWVRPNIDFSTTTKQTMIYMDDQFSVQNGDTGTTSGAFTSLLQDDDVVFGLKIDAAPYVDSGKYSLTVTTKSATEPLYTADSGVPITASSGYASFDGTNDYMYVATNTVVATSPLTISYWINYQAINSGEYDTAIYVDDNIRIGMTDGMAGDRKLVCVFNDGTATMKQAINTTFTASTWYHILVTWNPTGNIITAYVNGSQISITDTSGFGYVGYTDNRVYIGGRSDSVGLSQAYIDEVAIWTRVLTDDEIDSVYENGIDYSAAGGEGGGNYIVITASGTAGEVQKFAEYDMTEIWQHIGVTWDNTGAELKLYVNGVLQTLTDSTINWTTSGKTDGRIYIGAKDDSNFSNAYFDEVGVFKRVLSSAEITEIKLYGLRGNESAAGAGAGTSNVIIME